MDPDPASSERGAVVLVVAPLEGDASAIAREAETLGHPVRIIRTAGAFEAALDEAGDDTVLLAVVTEEGADQRVGAALERMVAREPDWSRVPVLFLAKNATRPPPACRAIDRPDYAPPPIVLERPVPTAVLRRVLQTQAAARRRQFQTGRLLEALRTSDEKQRFLRTELRHRTNNSLAVLQGLFSLSARKHDIKPEFVSAFTDRLRSVSDAYSAMSSEDGAERTVAELVGKIVSPYVSSGQLVCKGPEAEVADSAAFDLSLALNELAANAAKYGALSTRSGIVHVAWSVEPKTGELCIEWRESGGPPVREPEHTGLGMAVIERSAGDSSTITFAPDGVHWRARLEPELFSLAPSEQRGSES